MDTAAWLTILAIALAPALTVLALRCGEQRRRTRSLQQEVFMALMASRADRTGAEHLRALNLIEAAFYGKRILGMHRQSRRECRVIETWQHYREHFDDEQATRCLTNLLEALAAALGYRFDHPMLLTGINLEKPEHADVANLDSFLKLLTGEKTLSTEALKLVRKLKN